MESLVRTLKEKMRNETYMKHTSAYVKNPDLFNLIRGKGIFVLCLDKIERFNRTEIASSKEFS